MNAKQMLEQAAVCIDIDLVRFACVAILQVKTTTDSPKPEYEKALAHFTKLYKPEGDPPLSQGWFGSTNNPENQIKRAAALRAASESFEYI